MKNICIQPIVEGHGEVAAIRVLLSRIWSELLNRGYVHILPPIRVPRGKMVKGDELHRYLGLAEYKLTQEVNYENGGVLLLLDADNDLPCVLAQKICAVAYQRRMESQFSCVVANKEFETWFVASADRLEDEFPQIRSDEVESPEIERKGKRWISEKILGSYSETADMPRLCKRLDLTVVRERCPSFDKLCREMEKRQHG